MTVEEQDRILRKAFQDRARDRITDADLDRILQDVYGTVHDPEAAIRAKVYLEAALRAVATACRG